MDMREIFSKYKNIAVYGMSANQAKAAFTVPLYMIEHGYNVIPVNPVNAEIAGKKVYKKLTDIPDSIDILNVFRPSADCLDVVKEAIERHNEKGDIKLIWLQLGIINDDAQALAKENGIDFIQNKCIFQEHSAL